VTRNIESVFGLHAVRALLMRAPERVLRLRIAAGRDDARVRELSELAKRHGVPVERADAREFKCLRTADACGALALVVPKDRAAQLTPTVRKVAAGAAETTPVVTVTNLVRCLALLKGAGLWVVGAEAQTDRRPQDVDLTAGTVLVLGAEGAGLRKLTRQSCDFLVRLPQRGAVESLNVSVAAGMLLYEAVRQRKGPQN